MPLVLRALLTLLCLPVAAFSVFGYMASFEPGVGSGWKVGYAVLFFAALAAGLLPWLRRSRGA